MNINLYGRSGVVGVAIVDDADAALAELRWNLHRSGYVVTSDGGGRTVYMHRMVAHVVEGIAGRAPHVDHINGNKLDNRRANLRIGTTINRLNSRCNTCSRTGIKGVARVGNRWGANWSINGVRTWRYFDTQEEAIACRAEFNRSMNLAVPMARSA